MSTYIKTRGRETRYPITDKTVYAGLPGVPLFEEGQPNPDVYYQGEDIVYALYLEQAGSPVTHVDYDISAIVKTSPRAATVVWEGKVNAGLTPTPSLSGFYELWIPSVITEPLLAGSYFIDILITERIGTGQGAYDRKFVLAQTVFNLEYSNHSPAPESRKANSTTVTRGAVESTWPNSVNTVGKSPHQSDTFYSPG
jgi:hypothetical protein